MLELGTGENIHMFEVQVVDHFENEIAASKPSFQSSTFKHFNASRAVDGDISTSFSGLLTFTYFLRAFFESKDRTRCYKSRPITHHCLDNGLLLIAQPPHFTSSSTTLPSSSPSLPVVKFTVCGECASVSDRC
jgi:hypothetical protein